MKKSQKDVKENAKNALRKELINVVANIVVTSRVYR